MIEFKFCGYIEFEYTNYKGEHDTRRVCTHSIAWGSTEYHPQPQWILTGHCMDRRVTRGFAMRDMSNVRTWTPFKPKPEDPTEDAVDSEIATQRLADLASGKDKLISGPDLDARMKAWEL
jgi:hypothetical protein